MAKEEDKLEGFAAALLRAAQKDVAEQGPPGSKDAESAASVARPVEKKREVAAADTPIRNVRPEPSETLTPGASAEMRKSRRRGIGDLFRGMRGARSPDHTLFPAMHRFTSLLAKGRRKDSALANLPVTIGAINERVAEDLTLFKILKGEHSAVKDELQRLRLEHAKVKRDLAKATSDNTREKARLERQNGLLAAQITKFEEDEPKAKLKLTATITRLTTELETERARTSKLNRELADAVRKGAASDGDLELAREQVAVLNEQLDEMRRLLSGMGRLDGSLEAAVERLGKEKEILQLRVDSLEEMAGDLKEKDAALKRADVRIGTLEAEVSAFQTEIKRLGGALSDIKIIDQRPEAVAQVDETRIAIGRKMIAIHDKLPSLERDETYIALIEALKRATEVVLGPKKSTGPELTAVLDSLTKIEEVVNLPAIESPPLVPDIVGATTFVPDGERIKES